MRYRYVSSAKAVVFAQMQMNPYANLFTKNNIPTY